MKKIYLSIFLLIQLISPSQNLVPNPSFENVTSCPTGWNQLNKAFPWCGISSDESLLHACNITLAGSVPFSLTNMFQYPKTGNAFALVGMYNIPPLSYRGYAQVPLIQTLTISKKYIVKFYVNLNNDSRYAIDKIGALLTNSPSICNSNIYLPIIANPQIQNKSGIITDTLNWIEVCDTLTSNGNENYIMIGNFYSDLNTFISNPYPGSTLDVAYYNIDDVSIEELMPARCVKDTILCSGESIQLGLNQTETATYNWQPSIGLSCSFCANPKAEPSTTTTYILTKQDCNIITKDSVTITVKNDCNLQVQLPNVFTPNYDGINDVFKIELKNVTLTNFSIYDRWGILIKSDELKTHQILLWDGRTTAGEACTAGVYFYTLEYTDANGDIQKKNGYITLIK